MVSTRKKTAFRRILMGVTALLLVNHFLLVGLVLPIQAVRRFEEREGAGRTRVVCRDWAPEVHWSHLNYLSGNENVTMLSGAYLHVYGWTDAFGSVVDCSEPAPLHGGWCSQTANDELSLYYVFGRIDDPEIVDLQIQAQYEDWESGEAVRRTAFAWGSPREDWLEKDGRRYFLFRKYPLDWGAYPSPIYPVAIGYDAAGNEVARRELYDNGSSSHFYFNAD